MSTSPSYITREALRDVLLSPLDSRPNLAIIDVRDDDHVGGHIKTSTHVPSTTLDYRIPELVRTLRSKEQVVFHCALSQQRGPRAARRYLGERERVLRLEKEAVAEYTDSVKDQSPTAEPKEAPLKGAQQKVYVLDGGFVKWQEKYGRDPRLTDAFAADIWVDYY